MGKFINIDERYGEQVEVTIADYRDLNPQGEFEQKVDYIREYTVFGPFITKVWKVVAVMDYEDKTEEVDDE